MSFVDDSLSSFYWQPSEVLVRVLERDEPVNVRNLFKLARL